MTMGRQLDDAEYEASQLPPPGTVIGDISMHAPGVRFGVVLSPKLSERTERICSSDPTVWRPAVAELAGAIWPQSITDSKAEETKAFQLARWGVTGLALLDTLTDDEWGRILGGWQNADAAAIEQPRRRLTDLRSKLTERK